MQSKFRRWADSDPKALDNAVLILGFLEPVFALPQVVHLFSVQDATGLSLTTWILYLISSIIMIIWGVKRRLKPIYIPQSIWIALELIIIYGIIIY